MQYIAENYITLNIMEMQYIAESLLKKLSSSLEKRTRRKVD